ncbi:MAG: peptide-methionine (S)-S-oxide reductase MsrA [Gammaproteobacteria bacterium]|jgi:peptide-methionine (S)-S-oxide reductase|nr:peptide-methionine (S)-S-oxide reductase MsrA [Gammaproteobacteria bacterium]
MSEKATFGAGCFWGVEMRFREMDGVIDATVGYMGGHVEQPTYKQVCSDKTGHAEVCQVVFDPERIGYEKLVRAFFELHDPTQVNRQGPDRGRQYRSVVFAHDDGQSQVAERVKAELDASGRYRAPIATSIEPVATFWPAEDYHQQYLAKNGGSCSISGH